VPAWIFCFFVALLVGYATRDAAQAAVRPTEAGIAASPDGGSRLLPSQVGGIEMNAITCRGLVIALAAGIAACQQPGTRTAEEEANVATVEAWLAAYNAQEEGWFDRFHGEEVSYQHYSSSLTQGMTGNRERLKELAAGAQRMFPDRAMTVKSLVAEGDTVVMETVWTGTATDGHPRLLPGERQVIRNTLFNRFEDGKVVETREYGVVVSEAPAQAEETSSRTPEEQANEAAARRWLELWNERPPGWTNKVYAPDLRYEAVYRFSPPRSVQGREKWEAASARAAQLFRGRTMTLRNLVADGDRVVVECDWRATAAADTPGAKAGEDLRLLITFWLTFADGKITEVRERSMLAPANET
jgi:ketosteroid isomerase-like protein